MYFKKGSYILDPGPSRR